jgi:fumarate hydratase class II
MPGKVNPVMSEMVTMVAAQVIGNDAAITIGGERGNFELNVMIPVMVHNLLESIEILSSGSRTFADRCVAGITANEERCRRNAESTASLSTVLAPKIGYDKAAEVAKKSLKEDKTLREVVREMQLMSDDELEQLLDFARMTAPNVT